MQRSTFLPILGAIVVLLGGYLVYKTVAGNDQNSSATFSNIPDTKPLNSANDSSGDFPGPNQVSYTDNGFTPSLTTILVGTTVTFTNNSSGDMWVASSPHPTHTDLPGFDEKVAAVSGGTYSYTFNTVGNWGYHNHRNPSQGGTVVVVAGS